MTPAFISGLKRLLGRGPRDIIRRDLPRSAVTHDSFDGLAFGNMLEDSSRFRDAVERKPHIPSGVKQPDPIDITEATPEEVATYQQAMRDAREAQRNAPEYEPYGELAADLFYSLHTHDEPGVVEEVDPSVGLHPRVMQALLAQDAHAEAREMTRDDQIASAITTMGMMPTLRQVLHDHLGEQMRQQEDVREKQQEARERQEDLEQLRDQAKAIHDNGQPVPQELKDQIGEAVQSRTEAVEATTQVVENPVPMSKAALEGIEQVAEAGAQAAAAANAMPHFGAGMGAGEPTFTSPEQALSIAEEWANNPELRKMAELFGRLDRDIRFKRSRRVVGGNEEIVDIEFGDNLGRLLPSELALLVDPDYEDDFMSRFVSQEVLQFATVGEENAGRGPVLIVLDGSGSMHGERNVWSRAVAMCLLHITRAEKRDFALVEFSSGGQLAEWHFKANEPMPAERVLEMCSHMFGGGTTPIIGMTRATEIMAQAPAFSKADVVLVGDGEAGFGAEDEKLREKLQSLGVRVFGIGIGGSFSYILKYCEPDGYVVDVHEFDLKDPSAATAELATHIS